MTELQDLKQSLVQVRAQRADTAARLVTVTTERDHLLRRLLGSENKAACGHERLRALGSVCRGCGWVKA